jgi:predicted amidohydrolase
MTVCGNKCVLVVFAVTFLFSFALGRSNDSVELVSNPTFASSADKGLPAHWSVWTPVWEKAACTVKTVPGGLLVEAPSNPYAVGGVVQQIKNIQGGQSYAVEATCRLQNITAAYRSVLVRISWTGRGKLIQPAGMLVRGPVVNGDLDQFKDILVAPEQADGAEVSLEVKWPGKGSVLWRQVSVRRADARPARKVKVGTVYLRPRNSTPKNNLNLFCQQIDSAGKLGLDVVCLGEAITQVGTDSSVRDCAEPIPGPSTQQLGEAARRNRIWVVAGLTEREGDLVYNTAVLLNRDGQLAGKYRKVHLPREEWKKGITPGHSYPVFGTDFGTIAIQICYDWFFPEPEEIFALQGAEIIFAPTWGNTLPDENGCVNGETVFRVRAWDNAVFMVASVYDGNSLIIDPMGRILASSEGKQGVFWAEIDLNSREMLPWVGYWRSIGPRHRMPDTYAPLVRAAQEPTY